jgi:hypothetical protein
LKVLSKTLSFHETHSDQEIIFFILVSGTGSQISL